MCNTNSVDSNDSIIANDDEDVEVSQSDRKFVRKLCNEEVSDEEAVQSVSQLCDGSITDVTKRISTQKSTIESRDKIIHNKKLHTKLPLEKPE